MNNAEVLIKFKGDTTDADSKTQKMSTSIDGLTKSFTLASLAAQGVSKAIQVFNQNLDSAISRVDTLNNFPRVMSNLGVSARASEEVINDLSKRLEGLPTSLDAAAMAVQRLTSKNGDVKKSEELFLALNNAILAGGGSAQVQATALEQISQAYAKGKPDMMEWRTLMTAMPAQLKQVANAMGYVDAAMLGEAVRAKDGEKEFARMMETMTKMNTEGVNGFKSFDEQARNATGGISTSVTNMKTAITRGIASAIKSVDESLKKFGGLNGVLKNIGKTGEKIFTNIGKVIKKVIPYLIEFGKWVKNNESWIKPLAVGIATAVTAATGFKSVIGIIGKVKDAFAVLFAFVSAHPFGALAAAIGGVTAALITEDKELGSFGKRHEEVMGKIGEETQKIKDQEKAWKDLQTERQNNIDVGMTQLTHEQSLYDELQEIVNANGKIKKGYEDRAKFITGELSEALGVEIKTTDNVIKNYQNIQTEIEKAMEVKKAQILLNASEELYTEALKNQSSAQAEVLRLQKQNEKAQQNLNKYREKYAQLLDAEPDKLNSFQKTYREGVEKNIATLQKEVDATQKNYERQQKVVDNYYFEIAQYTKNYEHFKSKEYDKIAYIDSKYLDSMEMTGDAQKQQLEKEIQVLEASLKRKEELNQNSADDLYQQQITEDKKRLDALKEDLKKYTSAWGNGLTETLSTITGKTVQFEDVGKDQVQAYVNGEKLGEPVAKSKAKEIANGIINEFNVTGDATQAGIQLVNGLNTGLNDKKAVSGILASATNLANKLTGSLKKSLDIHSPSGITTDMGINLLKGFTVGIDKEENDLFNKISDFSKGIVDGLNTSINASISPTTISSIQGSNITPITNVYISQKQDPLGRMVQDVKTFSGGAKQDYLYGR